jgi:Mor family transcriptional regulator
MSKPKPALPYIPDENDHVAELLRMVIDMAPAFGIALEAQAKLAAKVNGQFRDLWGGDRGYIQKESVRQRIDTRCARNESIRREHRAGERIPYLARKYQISERQVTRVLQD